MQLHQNELQVSKFEENKQQLTELLQSTNTAPK